jgi:FKBP-type peptidyl-prolyl cis-trans isomerase SlyD
MKAQIVSFHCTVKNKFGKIISSTFNQDILTGGQNGHDPQLAGLAKGMENLKAGEKRKITLEASQAYGFYDPEMVLTMPRQNFPKVKKVKMNTLPIALNVDGRKKLFRVIELNSETITLDGNHPLAGQDLVFEIEAVTVRDAMPDEVPIATNNDLGPLFH